MSSSFSLCPLSVPTILLGFFLAVFKKAPCDPHLLVFTCRPLSLNVDRTTRLLTRGFHFSEKVTKSLASLLFTSFNFSLAQSEEFGDYVVSSSWRDPWGKELKVLWWWQPARNWVLLTTMGENVEVDLSQLSLRWDQSPTNTLTATL